MLKTEHILHISKKIQQLQGVHMLQPT